MLLSRFRVTSAIAVAFAATACGGGSTTSTADVESRSASPVATSSPPTTCGDPHAHVYSPDRLSLLAACVTVTGTIQSETPEADGDFHVRLRLDPDQTCAGQPCLNASNISEQAGDLLLEPVCENPISQNDAVAACQGYHNPLVLPAVNSHVRVMGAFVLDLDHGWKEIHPLESVTVIPGPSPSEAPNPTASTAATALFVKVTSSSYGFVAATTVPGASCAGQATLPSGRISTAAGLQLTVIAGNDGEVSWTYNTSSTTKAGTPAWTPASLTERTGRP
jgi:hypothetical protein